MPRPPILIPASYLILVQDGKVLLSRRYKTGYEDGKYSLPAGHTEKGETFTECILRESSEEIGITIDEKDLRVCHVMHRKVLDGPDDRVDVYFEARKWQGEVTNKEPQKCDDLAWFSFQELPENMVLCVKEALRCYQKNIFYSEFGWK